MRGIMNSQPIDVSRTQYFFFRKLKKSLYCMAYDFREHADVLAQIDRAVIRGQAIARVIKPGPQQVAIFLRSHIQFQSTGLTNWVILQVLLRRRRRKASIEETHYRNSNPFSGPSSAIRIGSI